MRVMIGDGNASGSHDRKRIATDGLGMEQYGAAKERIRPGWLGKVTARRRKEIRREGLATRDKGSTRMAMTWQRICSVTRDGEYRRRSNVSRRPAATGSAKEWNGMARHGMD